MIDMTVNDMNTDWGEQQTVVAWWWPQGISRTVVISIMIVVGGVWILYLSELQMWSIWIELRRKVISIIMTWMISGIRGIRVNCR